MCFGNFLLDTKYKLRKEFTRYLPEIEIVHIFTDSGIAHSFFTQIIGSGFLARRKGRIDEDDPFIR